MLFNKSLNMLSVFFICLFSSQNLSAAPYLQGLYGYGKHSTLNWGIGGGYDFEIYPWGAEFNIQQSSKIKTGTQKIEQQWSSFSATYRKENFIFEPLTFKTSLGLATLNQTTQRGEFSNNNFSWNLTSDIEIGYQFNPSFEIFAEYRFFIGETTKNVSAPETFMFGGRLYWVDL
ncbi:hypothetical protein BS333_20485 [Vibrio azureus]|uniref:Uncharacterized protein n=1 Tax=Vibrio azureus NBRC 104587 TaxID=1219077 RepID=U3CF77_9VIBR|nr:outer membrane beta-barrel protein [Vibrio azureus]AUI88665.1 hypothetical protein BS333_20485 [Vibrio azureus]GAD76953.1 hypothetical protein VAZ01S_056_00350 [Vibrio azureus NBRC 104587]